MPELYALEHKPSGYTLLSASPLLMHYATHVLTQRQDDECRLKLNKTCGINLTRSREWCAMLFGPGINTDDRPWRRASWLEENRVPNELSAFHSLHDQGILGWHQSLTVVNADGVAKEIYFLGAGMPTNMLLLSPFFESVELLARWCNVMERKGGMGIIGMVPVLSPRRSVVHLAEWIGLPTPAPTTLCNAFADYAKSDLDEMAAKRLCDECRSLLRTKSKVIIGLGQL